jgi:hypothetical protein
MSTLCHFAALGLRGGSWLKRSFRSLDAFLHGAWFAYGMLALLQAHVVWGMWRFRDLTTGDTSGYFMYARHWFKWGTVHIGWSPLYTSFYGTLLFLTQDVYKVTILHRLALIMVASLLVLAVFRRLLPSGIAWLCAAWWVVLPINFNTLYEVHLFALLPLLIVWLVLLAVPSAWGRGVAIATLAASTVLVRNEFSVATLLVGLSCALYEWHVRRRPVGQYCLSWKRLAICYGAPLLSALCLCAVFYERSEIQYPNLASFMRSKHTLNMAQVFTFGYQQRHPEWQKNPWLDHEEIMRAQFHEAQPSLREMMVLNPRATWRHFRWNWSLVPNGFQVLLFNATSGTVNPDYAPVKLRAEYAWWLTMLLFLCWLFGIGRMASNWQWWWTEWIRPRLMGWVGMLAIVAVATLVITSQRPRPSYLFGLSVFLMAVTGLSVHALTHDWPWANNTGRALLPLAMLGLVVFVPPYFRPGTQRPLHDLVRRLEPYKDVIDKQDSRVLLGDYAFESTVYVGMGCSDALRYEFLVGEWRPGVSLEQFLAEQHVDAFYMSEGLIEYLRQNRPGVAQAFLDGPPPPNWKEIGRGDAPGDRWRLFQRWDS